MNSPGPSRPRPGPTPSDGGASGAAGRRAAQPERTNPTPGTGEPILELTDVHVTIGGSHILQGIDARVRRGGVTALLGRNGVGKTTTVKSVLGLVPATGVVRFAGERIDGLLTHAVVRRGIGYVPEDREVFATLTVEENLKLAEPRAGQPDYDRAYTLFPDLYQRRRQRAGTLSGGQQQMLAIGRVLLGPTELLLVDEPTKGLAPLIVAQVGDALAAVAEHTTVLLVEQNLPLVRRIADDAIVIDTGRVVHSSPASDLLADEDLVNRLLGVAATTPASGPAQDAGPAQAPMQAHAQAAVHAPAPIPGRHHPATGGAT